MQVQSTSIIQRIIARVIPIRSEKEKPIRDNRDMSRAHRCYIASEAAFRDLERLKTRVLAEYR